MDIQLMIRINGNAFQVIENDTKKLRTTKSALLNDVVKNYARTFIKQKKRNVKQYEKGIKEIIKNTSEKYNVHLSKAAMDNLTNDIFNYNQNFLTNPTQKSERYSKEHFRLRIKNKVAGLEFLKQGYRIFNDDKEKSKKELPTAKFFNALFEQYASLTEYNRHRIVLADRVTELKKYASNDNQENCPYILATIRIKGGYKMQKWILRPYRITTAAEGTQLSLLCYTTFAETGTDYLLVKLPLWQILKMEYMSDNSNDARISNEQMRLIEELMHSKDSSILDDEEGRFRVLFTVKGLSQIDCSKPFRPETLMPSLGDIKLGLDYFGKEYYKAEIFFCTYRQLKWYLSSVSKAEYVIDDSARDYNEYLLYNRDENYTDTLVLNE